MVSLKATRKRSETQKKWVTLMLGEGKVESGHGHGEVVVGGVVMGGGGGRWCEVRESQIYFKKFEGEDLKKNYLIQVCKFCVIFFFSG